MDKTLPTSSNRSEPLRKLMQVTYDYIIVNKLITL